jgi:hypothetical protein
MESITMTTMTQMNRVRSACPQANPIRLAATRVWIQGTTVSGVASDARGVFGVKVRPAFYAGHRFGATAPQTTVLDTTTLNSTDVVHLRTGEPPV